MKFKIGDRVTYSKKFIKSICVHHDYDIPKGTIQKIEPLYKGKLATYPVYKDIFVATVLWDDDGVYIAGKEIPDSILSSNLKLV